jgi:hypothetical protein
MKDSRH